MNFQAGFGRALVNPDCELNMNSARKCSTVFENLYVSCLALSDGNTTLFFFSADFRGTPELYLRNIRKRLWEKMEIPPEHIFVTATHNHSAPDVSFAGTQPMDGYLERIVYPAFEDAARQALQDLETARVFAGQSKTEGVNFVRRYFREDGAFHGLHIPETSTAPIVRHESEADPSVRVVSFQREGKKTIHLVNWQNHAAEAAITHKGVFCPDFIGALRDALEPEENAQVLYLQGACGNVNSLTYLPHEQHEGSHLSGYHRIGQELARAVKEAILSSKEMKTGPLKVKNVFLTGKVNHEKTHMASRIPAIMAESDPEKRTKKLLAEGFASRYEVAAIQRRSKMGETAEIPLSAVSFGEVGMAFSPFEMFDSNYAELRAQSPFPFTVSVCYTNGTFNYLPSAFGFLHGGYEVLQCNYMPGTGEEVTSRLVRLLKELK